MSENNKLSVNEVPLTIDQCRDMGRSCVAHKLRRATRVISAHYDHAFKQFGLKATQVSILAAVQGMAEEEQGCRMSSLAKVLRMDESTLTRNMAILEREALVVITPGEDRRVREVALTSAGCNKLSQVYPLWLTTQQAMLDYLEPQAYEQLHSLLTHIYRFKAK